MRAMWILESAVVALADLPGAARDANAVLWQPPGTMTLRTADKVIVLKDGFVTEEGTLEDLLSRGGVYAGLHKAQEDTRSVGAVGWGGEALCLDR